MEGWQPPSSTDKNTTATSSTKPCPHSTQLIQAGAAETYVLLLLAAGEALEFYRLRAPSPIIPSHEGGELGPRQPYQREVAYFTGNYPLQVKEIT